MEAGRSEAAGSGRRKKGVSRCRIVEGVKISAALWRIFYEAARRDKIADEHQRAKPLADRWLGLGTATDYKPALDWGVMRWYSPPAKRCMGWLTFTPLGARIYSQLLPELKVRDCDTHGELAYSCAAIKFR